MIYSFLRLIAQINFRVKYTYDVQGAENMPRKGAYLLCANHVHALDPVILSMFTPRKPRYMSKAELFKNPLLGWFLRLVGAYPVQRGSTDMAAFRTTMNILNKGEGIIIFSQGTRMEGWDDAKAGVAVFALKSGAPVVPAFISWGTGFRRRIKIRFGTPLSMDEYAGQKVRSELVDQVMERIITSVQALE
jgi:1-acyl-sn-glycerol-3-phosphate acyltransferase